MTIRRRLKKLEAASGEDNPIQVFTIDDFLDVETTENHSIIGFSDPLFGPPEQVWHRREGESLADLRQRVADDMKARDPKGCGPRMVEAIWN